MPIRVQHLARALDERRGDRDFPLLSVSAVRGVIRRSEISDNEPRADDLSAYRVCRAGDIVINRMSAYHGALGKAKETGIVSPDYLVLRLKSNVNPEYIEYLFRSYEFVGEITSRVRGIGSASLGTVRTPRINWNDLGAIEIHLPVLDDQIQIVKYLDHETEQIDTLILKQKQLVEALGERRQATIAEAVTKKLFAGLTYKLKLIRAFEFLNGDRGANYPSPDEIQDEGVPFINAGDLVGGTLSQESLKYVSDEKYAQMGGAKVQTGDILYCLRGSLGKNAMVGNVANGSLASSLVAIRNRSPRKVSTRYIFWLLNSYLEQVQREVLSSGSAQPNLAAESVASMVFVVPHFAEQEFIASRLDLETSRSAALVAKAVQVIEVLQERRQALISAAVTGKIDVRGL